MPFLKGFALFGIEGLADLFRHRQLQKLLFLERTTDHITRGTADHLEQEPNLFVDALRRGLLAQAVLLIAKDRRLVDVDGHAPA